MVKRNEISCTRLAEIIKSTDPVSNVIHICFQLLEGGYYGLIINVNFSGTKFSSIYFIEIKLIFDINILQKCERNSGRILTDDTITSKYLAMHC